MQNYLNLLKKIKEQGILKGSARKKMPKTYSLFGETLNFDLSKGLPMITTKKISFNNIVSELVWFLKGDTNIKFLIDNKCNIWNQDAYNYYIKLLEGENKSVDESDVLPFDRFVNIIKESKDINDLRIATAQISYNPNSTYNIPNKCYNNEDYILGNCGAQYGLLWRKYGTSEHDQIFDLIYNLIHEPYSRRHIINNWNVDTLDDMALNACHVLAQFNCRPLSLNERNNLYYKKNNINSEYDEKNTDIENKCDLSKIPKYYLDINMYQRSGDVFLGVPYDITCYSLLVNIIGRITNMIPGNFTYFLGDVHIYEDHLDAVNIQLERTPKKLPTLSFSDEFNDLFTDDKLIDIIDILNGFKKDYLILNDYICDSVIKGKLSTGLY